MVKLKPWMRFRAGGIRQLTASWSLVREAAASFLTYELYPLGIGGTSLPAIGPLVGPLVRPLVGIGRPPTDSKVPILFIHGLLHNGSAFAWLKQQLGLRGWRHFREMNLSTAFHSIPAMAEQTAQAVARMQRKYNTRQIDIVAHSMGGLVARYYLQMLGGDQEGSVRWLVTLGTPHRGTRLSNYAFLSHLRELGPTSQTIRSLHECPIPAKTKVLSISGNLDVMMWPRDCARWEGVRHIHLNGVGHAGLLFSRRVIQILLAHLSDPIPNAEAPDLRDGLHAALLCQTPVVAASGQS